MATINSDKAWKAYGKKDPYFGVLTHDKFKDENLNEENKKEFFDTGRRYANRIFKLIHKHFDPDFNPSSILDFGCGTGRLTLGFAPNTKRVLGLDVSENMLEEAKINAKNMGQPHIEFALSDDSLSAVTNEQFELVNSYIVLQHINLERGMKIIKELIDRIKPSGYGVLQMTYTCNKSTKVKIVDFFRYRIPLVHGLMNVMQNEPYSKPLMQMNSYDMNAVFTLMQQNNIESSHLDFEKHGNCWAVTMVFQKKEIA